MDADILKKEKSLEGLTVEDQIEDKRLSIAQKKAIEAELKNKYGSGWKKIFGVLKVNRETIHDLYAIDPSLRDLTRPPKGIRRA